MSLLFEDRIDAGKKLAKELSELTIFNPLILALPRGGVIVADEVAKKLHAPLNVVVARKIGLPGHPELGMAAISEDESLSYNEEVFRVFNSDSFLVKGLIQKEVEELRRRRLLYRRGFELPDLTNKTVIVVDDGLATGTTAIAAAKYIRQLHPEKLMLAVPIGPTDMNPELKDYYDDIVCLQSIEELSSVGLWYHDFSQVEDEKVLDVLRKYH